jgi:hypothetical protein
MQHEGASNQHDSPTYAEIEEFDEMLRSEPFSYTPQMQKSCSGWLQAREGEFSNWVREFRASGPELNKPLLNLRANLVDLYDQLDRLCGAPRSYLAVGKIELDESSQRAFAEFIAAWDKLRLSTLPRYHLFANAYDIAIKDGRLIDAEAKGVNPDSLHEELMELLAVMRKALGRLATGWPRPLARVDTAEPERHGDADSAVSGDANSAVS